MTWSVHFRGNVDEVDDQFDAAAEELRDQKPAIGEFEDLEMARNLVHSSFMAPEYLLCGSAAGYWLNGEFQAFTITIERYVDAER